MKMPQLRHIKQSPAPLTQVIPGSWVLDDVMYKVQGVLVGKRHLSGKVVAATHKTMKLMFNKIQRLDSTMSEAQKIEFFCTNVEEPLRVIMENQDPAYSSEVRNQAHSNVLKTPRETKMPRIFSQDTSTVMEINETKFRPLRTSHATRKRQRKTKWNEPISQTHCT